MGPKSREEWREGGWRSDVVREEIPCIVRSTRERTPSIANKASLGHSQSGNRRKAQWSMAGNVGDEPHQIPLGKSMDAMEHQYCHLLENALFDWESAKVGQMTTHRITSPHPQYEPGSSILHLPELVEELAGQAMEERVSIVNARWSKSFYKAFGSLGTETVVPTYSTPNIFALPLLQSSA